MKATKHVGKREAGQRDRVDSGEYRCLDVQKPRSLRPRLMLGTE